MKHDENKIWGTENSFRVPDGYFENFTRQIQEKIDPSLAVSGKTPRKLSLFAPWIGLAAAFLIIALAYRQLPERIYPKQFNLKQADAELLFELSPWYLPGDYEIMEYISGKNDLDLNIYPDSIIFDGIKEEDLIMLTLFQ